MNYSLPGTSVSRKTRPSLTDSKRGEANLDGLLSNPYPPGIELLPPGDIIFAPMGYRNSRGVIRGLSGRDTEVTGV